MVVAILDAVGHRSELPRDSQEADPTQSGGLGSARVRAAAARADPPWRRNSRQTRYEKVPVAPVPSGEAL